MSSLSLKWPKGNCDSNELLMQQVPTVRRNYSSTCVKFQLDRLAFKLFHLEVIEECACSPNLDLVQEIVLCEVLKKCNRASRVASKAVPTFAGLAVLLASQFAFQILTDNTYRYMCIDACLFS